MRWNKAIPVGEKVVGQDRPVYVIAEIGSNHNQSMSFAKESIDAAACSGADAVKFQSLKYDELYTNRSAPDGVKELFEKIKLEEDWHSELKRYAQAKGVHFMSAPTYPKAVDILNELDVYALKIASPQFGLYPEVLERAIDVKKPIFFSAGLATIGEIDKVLRYCQQREFYDAVLMHCVSQYPTPPAAANLNMIKTIPKMFGCLVGYSDHTLGIHFPIAAAALGACLIEKHFTLDKTLEGPDHHFAIEPSELENMVAGIREVKDGLGSGQKAELTDWEVSHRNKITMRYCATRHYRAGEPILFEDLIMRRADHGFSRQDKDLLMSGRVYAKNEIDTGKPLTLNDISIV